MVIILQLYMSTLNFFTIINTECPKGHPYFVSEVGSVLSINY